MLVNAKQSALREFSKILAIYHVVLLPISSGASYVPFRRILNDNISECEYKTLSLYKENNTLASTLESVLADTVEQCNLNGLFGSNMTASIFPTNGADQVPLDSNTCVLQIPNDISSPRRSATVSYSSFQESELYADVVSGCMNFGEDYMLCTVNATFTGEYLSVLAKDQPVCVPSSCGVDKAEAETIINVLGSNLCNTGNASICEFASISSLNCGGSTRPPSASGESCSEAVRIFADYTNSNSQTYEAAVIALDFAVVQACDPLGTMVGCVIDVVPTEIKMSIDFDDLKTDEAYISFMNDCENNEGSFCSLSFNFTAIANFDTFMIEGSLTVTGLPLCFPDVCSQDEATELVKELSTLLLSHPPNFHRRLSSAAVIPSTLVEKIYQASRPLIRRLQGSPTLDNGSIEINSLGGDPGNFTSEFAMNLDMGFGFNISDICASFSGDKSGDDDASYSCTLVIDELSCMATSAGSTPPPKDNVNIGNQNGGNQNASHETNKSSPSSDAAGTASQLALTVAMAGVFILVLF